MSVYAHKCLCGKPIPELAHLCAECFDALYPNAHKATDGIGGYITQSLRDARKVHLMRGGFLLLIGDHPATYAVCGEPDALDAWGRTHEQLAALAPDYTEA